MIDEQPVVQNQLYQPLAQTVITDFWQSLAEFPTGLSAQRTAGHLPKQPSACLPPSSMALSSAAAPTLTQTGLLPRHQAALRAPVFTVTITL